MFKTKYLYYNEAIKLVGKRSNTPNDLRNELNLALREDSLSGEAKFFKLSRENPNHEEFFEVTEWTAFEKWNELKLISAWDNGLIGYPIREGATILKNIRFARADIDQFWRDPDTPKEVHTGGNKTKYDWEGALIELARRCHYGELSQVQADEVRNLQDWLGNKHGEPPSDSGIKLRVSDFFRTVRPFD